MSDIFGGSRQSSSSSGVSQARNVANPWLKSNFGNTGKVQFNQANQVLGQELNKGWQNYKNRTGYDFMEKLGLRKVAGGFSGRGAFQSGAALKALAGYENQLSNQAYQGYLDNQFKRANLGLGAGQLVGSTGNMSRTWNASSSDGRSSDGGLGALLGNAAAMAALSDRRAKTDIKKIGQVADTGMGLYTFKYKGDPEGVVYTGVMADEVEAFLPEALGPITEEGYRTVYYHKITEETGHGFE